MKHKQLILAFCVAVMLAATAARVEAFCLWDWCEDLDTCWWYFC